MKNIINMLEKAASKIEGVGFVKQAKGLDSVANTLDVYAATDSHYVQEFNRLNLKLYLDMDGVITEWIGHYNKLTGQNVPYVYDDSFQNQIDWEGVVNKVEFWTEMPWTRDGKMLWDVMSVYDPIILSKPTIKDSSRVGKKVWVERELPDGIEVILDRDKSKYANSTSILIDDDPRNIAAWEEAGGKGIRHTDTVSTIKAFKEYIDNSMHIPGDREL